MKMGNLKTAFKSVPCALAVLCFCLFIGMSLEITPFFGAIFSLGGIITVAFTIFGMYAK